MTAKPFLRWAGGKRWLAGRLSPLLSARLGSTGVYIEPFLGSGAIFFATQPVRALLSDVNEGLITTFEQVARHPRAIITRLSRIPATRREYLRVRRWSPQSALDMAVRFIYLNRNCYGGLHRENQAGIFNVPYGGGERNHLALCSDGAILDASRLLKRPAVKLRTCDFEKVLRLATAGDVVYCDPTYREVTRRQFDRYGRTVFQWRDQERLAGLAREAFERGATVILSNATCNGIRALYQDAAVIEVQRRKGLGPAKSAGTQREFLFVMDPLHDWESWAATIGCSCDTNSHGQ